MYVDSLFNTVSDQYYFYRKYSREEITHSVTQSVFGSLGKQNCTLSDCKSEDINADQSGGLFA